MLSAMLLVACRRSPGLHKRRVQPPPVSLRPFLSWSERSGQLRVTTRNIAWSLHPLGYWTFFLPVFSSSVNGQISHHGINHLPFFLITPLCYQKQTNRRESKTLSNGYWFKTSQTISMSVHSIHSLLKVSLLICSSR